MKTVARARSVGGSLVITLPREIIVEEGIKPGELIEIDVNRIRKSYFGAFPNVGPFTREEELDTHD